MQQANVFNPNRVMGIRTAKLYFNDSYNPLFRIKYEDVSKDASAMLPFCRLAIDNNYSSTTKLVLLLDVGASSTDYTQYQFSASGVAVVDPNGVATGDSIVATATTDLGALIDALNAIDGIKAFRLNAPADYSLDTDDFVTAASVAIGPLFTDHLYKDVSEVLTAAIRIGVPEEFDHGFINLIGARAYANSNSDTDCEIKISRDPTDGAAGENDEVELGFTRCIPDAATTELYDFHEAPPSVQGPLLIEITATTSLAENAWVLVTYQSAEF